MDNSKDEFAEKRVPGFAVLGRIGAFVAYSFCVKALFNRSSARNLSKVGKSKKQQLAQTKWAFHGKVVGSL